MLSTLLPRVLVTGVSGFLGEHLAAFLTLQGCKVSGIALTHPYQRYVTHTVDLRERSKTIDLIKYLKPDAIFHLAGYNGGIKFNDDFPADIFANNTLMAMNVLEAARYVDVKVISVVSSCAYPNELCLGTEYQCSPDILVESTFLEAPPHHSVACHGYAKRNLFLASRYYHQQYNVNAVCVCPTTLYGPGDSFDINRSKVMGGMISRFLKAKQERAASVTCWGTGAAQREFLYVKDACLYLALAATEYNNPYEIINVGSGEEISIKELAIKVAKAVKYDGEILWDTSKPDGQLRKRLDRSKQNKYFPNVQITPLEQGIQQTVEWCLQEGIV